jgi:hypothetical protein
MPSAPTHALAWRQQAAQQELGEDEGRHELHRLELSGGERTLTGGGPRVEASPGGLDETDSYEEQDRDDEDVRGGREERAGLAYATRLPASKTTITPIPIATTSGLSEGIAEVIAARPAATPPSSGRREVVRLDG